MYSFGIFFLILCQSLMPADSSAGDRTMLFHDCLAICRKDNCTLDGYTFSHASGLQQEFWSWLVGWTCFDECRYSCMWEILEKFQELYGYVPKFYGKWPFIRMFGMQEPASAIASVLNLATNFYMHRKIRYEFGAKRVPIVFFWNFYSCVCMTAWVWSTAFHIKDSNFTEFMDYVCALALVMGLFVSAIVRLFHKRRVLTIILLAPTFAFYVNHVQQLYNSSIYYEYNMLVNILFGAAGCLIWLCWSIFHYIGGRRYVWRMIAFTLLSGAALSLEVLDFPPKYHLDAHALWHFATVPLPLLFFQFVIDDLRWMQGTTELKFKRP